MDLLAGDGKRRGIWRDQKKAAHISEESVPHRPLRIFRLLESLDRRVSGIPLPAGIGQDKLRTGDGDDHPGYPPSGDLPNCLILGRDIETQHRVCADEGREKAERENIECPSGIGLADPTTNIAIALDSQGSVRLADRFAGGLGIICPIGRLYVEVKE